MNDQLILKNRIKEARTERKLSQAALAELVGVIWVLAFFAYLRVLGDVFV